MLYASLLLNIAILVPLCAALLTGNPGMDAAFGPDTEARRILTCVSAAICVVSIAALALALTGPVQMAIALAIPLFVVQILCNS